MMIHHCFRAILPAIACLALFSTWPLLAAGESLQHPILQDQHNATLSFPMDTPFIRSETFAFDVNLNRYDDHFTIRENVSSTAFPGGVTGGFKLVKGDEGQQHSFMVLVRISSSKEEALDFVSMRNDSNTLYVNSTSSPRHLVPLNGAQGFDIQVDIVIFVKPRVMQFGHTNIWTENFDIEIWKDLWFETYHMSLSSGQGSIVGSEINYFTAHEISVSTVNGPITGNWSVPSFISFTTVQGNIDIDLIPKRWSSGPWTTGDLSASSTFGDIEIRMPFDGDKLSLRNGTTRVEAPAGSISGTFVHGAVTSLVARHSINATLLPYWAFYEWSGIQHNYITTDSRHGNTSVVVLPPVIDSYYKTNPLFFAVSRHTQGSWAGPPEWPILRMQVQYPGEWGGTAVGHSKFGGRVFVSGDDYEELERNRSTIKVQRPPVGSDLLFEVDMGAAELHLEPCDSLRCGFYK